MSTPAYKKALRLQQQAEAKRQRDFDKKYGTLTAKKQKREFVPLTTSPQPYYRETPHYNSLSTSDKIVAGSTAPPERKVYTGDLIVGIATMHKSNLVPVMRGTTQAEDIAKMRRG